MTTRMKVSWLCYPRGASRVTVVSVGRLRFGLAALAAAALLAAGCGEGADDTNVVTTSAVGAVLAAAVEAPVYRVSTSGTQMLKLPSMGPGSQNEMDIPVPTVVATISPERQHVVMRVALLSVPQNGGGDAIEFEIWSDGERLVMDTRGYQRLLDDRPGIELGPLEPGLFFVDKASMGSSDPELLSALAGPSAQSLEDLAENLPAALNTIDQMSENPVTYVGSTTVARLIDAQGGDVAVAVRSTAAAMSLLLAVSVGELTELLVEAYGAAPAEVVIELDDQGRLSVLSTRQDLSGVFTALSEAENFLVEMTDQERQEETEALEDAEFILETRAVYEVDTDLEVPLPPATTEDRTDEWREFLISAGFDS